MGDTPRSLDSRSSLIEHSYDGVNIASIEALLQLVAAGNVLLADLMKASQDLPGPLRDVKRSRYAAVMFDFTYLQKGEALESGIAESAQLVELDRHFRTVFEKPVTQVYRLLEAIIQYHAALLKFIKDLQAGVFLQSSVESLLLGPDGKQLFVEACSILGVLLLVLDRLLPSPVREVLVIAYFRLRGGMQAVGPGFNSVVSLTKPTALSAQQQQGVQGRPVATKSPPGYPEQYLHRLPLPSHVVRMLVNKMRSDDIYSHANLYHSNQHHQSIALAKQAGHLYVLLYYIPDVLRRETAAIRELVDKHYYDIWVVWWAPGMMVDLTEAWDSYPAAKAALLSIVTPMHVRSLVQYHLSHLQELRERMHPLVQEGILTEDYLLENTSEVFNIIRTANVTLCWLLLHGTGSCERSRKLQAALVQVKEQEEGLIGLLMDVAEVEECVQRLYTELMSSLPALWHSSHTHTIACIQELDELFGGRRVGSLGLHDERLAGLLRDIAQEVMQLQMSHAHEAAKKARLLMAALSSLESQIRGMVHIKHTLGTTKQHLRRMMCILRIRREELAALGTISNFAYGWGVMRSCMPALQAYLRSEPANLRKVKPALLKMTSLMTAPLERLQAASCPDLPRIAEFYSSLILTFAHDLLQVVPRCLCELVESVVLVQQSAPSFRLGRTVEWSRLAAGAQLPQREDMTRLKHRIALYSRGVSHMQDAVLGTLHLDAQSLVRDGLRELLGQRIRVALHRTLFFSQRSTPFVTLPAAPPAPALRRYGRKLPGGGGGELQAKLQLLTQQLQGLRQALEYVQNHLALSGLSFWQDEEVRTVQAVLQQELSHLSAFDPVGDATTGSASQNAKPVPLDELQLLSWATREARPSGSGTGALPVTSVGRLAAELLRLTDPSTTRMDVLEQTWMDGLGQVTLSPTLLRHVRDAVGVAGILALDTLLRLRDRNALASFTSLADSLLGTSGRKPLLALCLQDLIRYPILAMAGSNAAETNLWSPRQTTSPMAGATEAAAASVAAIATVQSAKAAPSQLRAVLESARNRLGRRKAPTPAARQLLSLLAQQGQGALVRLALAAELQWHGHTLGSSVMMEALQALDHALVLDLQRLGAGPRAESEATACTSGRGSSGADPAAAQALLGSRLARKCGRLCKAAGQNLPLRPGLVPGQRRLQPPPHLAGLLFLLVAVYVPQYHLQEGTGQLQRPCSSAAAWLPDPVPLAAGTAMLVQVCWPQTCAQFLQLCGDYLCGQLSATTPGLLASADAAEVEPALPQEVRAVVGFLQHFHGYGGCSRRELLQAVPVFLLASWQTAAACPT